MLPTPPRGVAVSLELSIIFMGYVVLGLSPSGVMALDGALTLGFQPVRPMGFQPVDLMGFQPIAPSLTK